MKRQNVGFISEDCKSTTPLSKSRYEKDLSDFGGGTKVTITIEHYRRTLTPKQNGYLHHIFDAIAKYTGSDPHKLKEALKATYGEKETLRDKDGNELCDENGEIIVELKSLADYNTEEASLLTDKVRQWALDFLGFYIMTPDEWRENNINY